jgi:hypothetical protein
LGHFFATSKTLPWPLRQGKKSFILKQWFVVEIMIKTRALGRETFVLATCSFQFANQGRQRRDAAVAEEEQLSRSKAGRLYLYSYELKVAALSLRRVRVACHNFAAGAPPLTHAYTVVTPPAWASLHKTAAWASGGPAGGRLVAIGPRVLSF